MDTRSTRIALTLSASVLLAALAGCGSSQSSEPASGPAHWSYEGSTGPAHWGKLSPDYALCATGKAQSPVNIKGQTSADLPNIMFSYQAVPVEVVNNGHTIQVNYAPGSSIGIDGVRYELAQFHFHSPSEHEIAGDRAEAEMHLVHKSDAGELAVVGVMIEEGAHNTAFDPVWAKLPSKPGPAVMTGATIDAGMLLPLDRRTIRYTGSLTTPPGTEGVKWNLMVQPVTMSKAQLDAFRRIIKDNNRPVQPLNGRPIVQDSSK
jgi:carbonic anhydrase